MRNGRCRMHGGSTPVGPASPHWKTGKRSILLKTLPKSLEAAALDVITSPNYVEMREHLGVLNAMLVSAIERWENGDTFPALQTAWDALTAALATDGEIDRSAISKHTAEITRLLASGEQQHKARTETRAIIQDIRRVSESERKRLIDAELMLSADQVLVIVSRVSDAIMQEVSDPDTLNRLHRRFATILAEHRGRMLAERASS